MKRTGRFIVVHKRFKEVLTVQATFNTLEVERIILEVFSQRGKEKLHINNFPY